ALIAEETPPPARVLASIGLMPAALTRTRSSPEMGWGRSRSAMRNTLASPGASMTAARIVAVGETGTIAGGMLFSILTKNLSSQSYRRRFDGLSSERQRA